MRVNVRRKVDISRTVELTELPPVERILTAIRYKYSTSRLHKSKAEKEANKLLRIRMKRMEDLKQVLLYHFNNRLYNDRSVKMIEITIDRSFEDIVEETIGSSDFISYKIKMLKENRDILTAFPDLPIVLEVSRI